MGVFNAFPSSRMSLFVPITESLALGCLRTHGTTRQAARMRFEFQRQYMAGFTGKPNIKHRSFHRFERVGTRIRGSSGDNSMIGLELVLLERFPGAPLTASSKSC